MGGNTVSTSARMKELYKEIQHSLFDMIPEKWNKIFLYASVIDGRNSLETGEMYFYYIPKGILKREPVDFVHPKLLETYKDETSLIPFC